MTMKKQHCTWKNKCTNNLSFPIREIACKFEKFRLLMLLKQRTIENEPTHTNTNE